MKQMEDKWEWNESKDNFLSLIEWNVCAAINKERDKQIHQLWLWLEKPTIDWIGSRVGWLIGGVSLVDFFGG